MHPVPLCARKFESSAAEIAQEQPYLRSARLFIHAARWGLPLFTLRSWHSFSVCVFRIAWPTRGACHPLVVLSLWHAMYPTENSTPCRTTSRAARTGDFPESPALFRSTTHDSSIGPRATGRNRLE